MEAKRRHVVRAGLVLISGTTAAAASSGLSCQHQVPPLHPSHHHHHTHTHITENLGSGKERGRHGPRKEGHMKA